MAGAKGKKIAGAKGKKNNEPCLIPNPELTLGVVPYVNLGFREKSNPPPTCTS